MTISVELAAIVPQVQALEAQSAAALPYTLLPAADASPAVNVANWRTTVPLAQTGKVGATLLIPRLAYTVNDTLEVRDVFGLVVQGMGALSLFSGAFNDASKPIFRLAHVHSERLRDFKVKSPQRSLALFQLIRDNLNSPTYAPSLAIFEGIRGDGQGNTDYGWLVGGPGSTDANNDFNWWLAPEVGAYRIAGWSFHASQSYGNMLIMPYATGFAGGKYGILQSELDNGGSYISLGGFFGGHTVAGVSFGRSYQPQIQKWANREGERRWFNKVAANYSMAIFEGERWSGGDLDAADPVGFEIMAGGPAQISLRNNHIGDGSRASTLSPVGTLAGLTDTRPPVATFTAPHGLANNDVVTISGVVVAAGGNGLKGTFKVTAVTPLGLTLLNTNGSPAPAPGTYVSGGAVSKVTYVSGVNAPMVLRLSFAAQHDRHNNRVEMVGNRIVSTAKNIFDLSVPLILKNNIQVLSEASQDWRPLDTYDNVKANKDDPDPLNNNKPTCYYSYLWTGGVVDIHASDNLTPVTVKLLHAPAMPGRDRLFVRNRDAANVFLPHKFMLQGAVRFVDKNRQVIGTGTTVTLDAPGQFISALCISETELLVELNFARSIT